MSSQPQSIPPQLVAAEARAAAHELQAIAHRLMSWAALLPMPEPGVLDRVSGSEAFARFPAYELRADIQVCVADGIRPVAEVLAKAGQRLRANDA